MKGRPRLVAVLLLAPSAGHFSRWLHCRPPDGKQRLSYRLAVGRRDDCLSRNQPPHTVLFNSLTFVVFFVVVVGAYWALKSWAARKNLLLVASYIFYGAWNPPFALLLFATTALDFYLGSRIAGATQPRARKAWVTASVISNLSMLGFFKYGNFLLQNFQWLLARGGIAYSPPHLDILLPVGISFYTFHSPSSTLDI